MTDYIDKFRAESGYQLQLWDAKTKQYAPAASDAPRGKSWRICKPDRETKNPKHRPPAVGRAPSRTVSEVRFQYMGWAESVGLETISDWKTARNKHPRFTIRVVDEADFYGPTAPEVDPPREAAYDALLA